MKNSMIRLFSGLVLLFVFTVASAQETDPVILKVAGENISKSEFLNVYQKNNVNGEVIDRKSLEEYMELYINFRLKVKEAEQLGLDTMRSFIDELAGYRKQLAQPYLIDEGMNKSLLQEAYNRKTEDIRASHILIKVDRNAPAADTLAAYKRIMLIRKRIMKGEDFGKLAMENSDDLSANDRTIENRKIKGNRGDLGYFTVFDMVYPFESGAYNTPMGEVSMPVRSDFGYHLIKVTDRKPALGRVQVAHILLRIPPDAKASDSTAVAAKAMEAYNKVISGEDFARVAEQYSDDKSTASKGGVLPWFGANKMIPEFIKEVSAIKNINDVAKPFSSNFGWHIVKLVDRKEIGSYEDNLSDLKQSLTRNDRAKKSEEALLNRIRKEYKFSQNQKALNAFYNVVTDTIFSGGWKIEQAAGLKKKMMTIGSRTFNQQDFAQYLFKNQRKRNKEDIRVYVNSMFTTFVNENCLAYEDSRLESKYPEFKSLVKEYRDGILLFELTDRKIWSKAVKDSTGLEAYYNNHKNSYMWDQRLDATIYTFTTTDDKILSEARKSILKGITDNELLGMINTDSTSVLSIDRRKFLKGDNALIDEIDWKPGMATETATKDKVTMIMVNEVVKPEIKKLNEARGIITADYQNYLEQEWIKELRSKYPYEVNREVLSAIK
ncbi:MAG: peptidyl-prolyl cis-trans isomerase SurA [Bacteroidetes bacterium]|nr:MAG: peptidyl-prolyl cis-trans isomerase SurA [Bacteroidota bacterium]